MRKFIVSVPLCLLVIILSSCSSTSKTPASTPTKIVGSKTPVTNAQGKLSEPEARIIAEDSCIKGGEALGTGTYNENSKTWWFDANLNATKEGCNPACVVSEDTKTAEINWRCTGAIPPKASADEIKAILVKKCPKYAKTITVQVNQETPDHARGSVSFEASPSCDIVREGSNFVAERIFIRDLLSASSLLQ